MTPKMTNVSGIPPCKNSAAPASHRVKNVPTRGTTNDANGCSGHNWFVKFRADCRPNSLAGPMGINSWPHQVATAPRFPLYRNPAAPAARRVKDLLSAHDAGGKSCADGCASGSANPRCSWTDTANLRSEQSREASRTATASVRWAAPAMPPQNPPTSPNGRNARRWTELTNAFKSSSLRIRAWDSRDFHEECLHGHAAKDATSFPQPIALARHSIPRSSNASTP